jgi:hypothetical protein
MNKGFINSFFSLDTEIIIVETITTTINKYYYQLTNIIPHTSVIYNIFCYNDDTQVKYISGLLDGEQYKEWLTDEWMDAFIKKKVEELNSTNI